LQPIYTTFSDFPVLYAGIQWSELETFNREQYTIFFGGVGRPSALREVGIGSISAFQGI
jgi:hypothetical protein